MDKINDLVFDIKLKDIKFPRNYKILSYTLGIVFFSQHFVYSHPSVENGNEVFELLNNYGPPLFLTTGELIKTIIPIKMNMKNS